MTVQVRDLDENTVRVLKTRAAAEGLSFSAYLRRLLTAAAEQPTVEEVFARASRRPSADVTMADVVEAVRKGRGE